MKITDWNICKLAVFLNDVTLANYSQEASEILKIFPSRQKQEEKQKQILSQFKEMEPVGEIGNEEIEFYDSEKDEKDTKWLKDKKSIYSSIL